MPELYVIYTGDEKNIPKTVSVRRDLFNNDNVPFDAVVNVITNGVDEAMLQKAASMAAQD